MRKVQASQYSIDSLEVVDAPRPSPGPGEVLIRVSAVSLNYRDLAVLSGEHLPNIAFPFVPCSDACGEVVEVGGSVTRFRPGDRVLSCYIQDWRAGRMRAEHRPRTLGGPLPGVLQEYVVLPADDVVAAPRHLSDREASTLPIAALTAWTALQEAGVVPGDNVLVQGTGGVSLFALQLALAAGARVVALTSSSEKAAMLTTMGAAAIVDYRKNPSWAQEVCEVTGGQGADIVIETAGSIDESLEAIAFGGFVAMIGFLGSHEVSLRLRKVIGPNIRLQGIVVGSRDGFEAMNRALELHDIHPVIDQCFPLERAIDAFNHMRSASHVGKIVIEVASSGEEK